MKYLRKNQYELIKDIVSKDKIDYKKYMYLHYAYKEIEKEKNNSLNDVSINCAKFILMRDDNADNTPGLDPLKSAALMSDHLLSMKVCGEKIYYIDEDISNLLMDTNISIGSEFLELPFDQIYIEFLSNKISFNNDGIFMIGSFVKLHKIIDTTFLSFWIILNDGNNIVFRYPIEDCDDLNKFILNNVINDCIEDSELRNFYIKLIINTIIYIGCSNAEMKEIFPIPEKQLTKGKTRSESDKIRSQIKNSAQCPYIYVTHRWAENEDREAHRFGKRLNKEVLVAAYWAGRWIGPRDSPERKKVLTRISSYLKGVGGEPSNKIHIVK